MFLVMSAEWAVEKTMELPVVWDAETLMWYYSQKWEYHHFDDFSSLAPLKVVKMRTSSAASYENFMKYSHIIAVMQGKLRHPQSDIYCSI